MTAAPESRVSLVLADSMLSPFLVFNPKGRGDDDGRLPNDVLRHVSHNTRRRR